LFVAVYPPEPVAEDLAALVRTLEVGRAGAAGVNARLAPQTFWHVTLAFLGEVPEQRQADVEKSVGEAVTSWSARADATDRAGPPVLQVGGGGRFGRGRFTVLWAGLRGDVTGVRALAAAVRRRLRRARLPVDDKPLRPHLTIARPGDRLPAEAVAADRAALEAYQGPQWIVDEVRLVRSHLGPKPRYDYLATWSL
jgi:2'-5' RNA ligase